MSRLEETLSARRGEGRGAFVPFLVVGDPDPATSQALADTLVGAGADILEFGFAFSDPPADGPVIQAADQRALAAGMTTDRNFRFLEDLRARTDCPFSLLVYYNLVLRHGVERFYGRAKDAGVDAILIADLPLEESKQVIEVASRTGVAPIFITSELTSPDRLARILDVARGYLYVVTHLGVTGERGTIEATLTRTLRAQRARTELPLLAGFGISTPAQVRGALSAGADGAIVGSALVRQIEENLDDRRATIARVRKLAQELGDAAHALYPRALAST